MKLEETLDLVHRAVCSCLSYTTHQELSVRIANVCIGGSESEPFFRRAADCKYAWNRDQQFEKPFLSTSLIPSIYA